QVHARAGLGHGHQAAPDARRVPAQGLGDQLLLAAREVVVDRTPRSPAAGQDVAERRARVAPLPQQVHSGENHVVPAVGRHTHPLTMTVYIVQRESPMTTIIESRGEMETMAQL